MALGSIGQYQLLKRLAASGMGEAFLAQRYDVPGPVVVKRVLPELLSEESVTARFRREAEILAGLSHRNIVQVFEIGIIDGSYFIAMEYVEGPDLRALHNHLSKLTGAPAINLCAWVIARACDGLEYLHTADAGVGDGPMGFIHRDVSPDNILVSRSGVVKLIDFGLAKAISSKTRSRTLRGKFSYIAPELLDGAPPSPRTDIFSMGIVLYEFVSGRSPWNAVAEGEVLQAIRNEPHIPIAHRRTEVPPALSEVIDRALAKDPERRFTSCAELAAALDGISNSGGLQVTSISLAAAISSYGQTPATASVAPAPGAQSPSDQGRPTTPLRAPREAQPDDAGTTPLRPPREAKPDEAITAPREAIKLPRQEFDASALDDASTAPRGPLRLPRQEPAAEAATLSHRPPGTDSVTPVDRPERSNDQPARTDTVTPTDPQDRRTLEPDEPAVTAPLRVTLPPPTRKDVPRAAGANWSVASPHVAATTNPIAPSNFKLPRALLAGALALLVLLLLAIGNALKPELPEVPTSPFHVDPKSSASSSSGGGGFQRRDPGGGGGGKSFEKPRPLDQSLDKKKLPPSMEELEMKRAH